MNGLEKIAAQIRQQSQQEADALIAQAQRAADEQVAFAQTAADRAAAQAAAAARNHADAEVARASAAAAADGRRQLLAEKQAQIASVLDEAVRRIAALPDDAYFDRMLRMAARAAQPGDGEMVLSAADLQRLPGGFESRLNAALAGRGTLHISAQPRDIDGGFVLVYGDIEENGTLAAQLDDRRAELQDMVNRILFD